ncbi:MAG: B12-binding domain-containing protein [Acidimicrobiales bacterium]
MDLQSASDRLGVHYQTAYRWVRDGSLPARKIGAAYEISDRDVEAFLLARSTPVPPPRTTVVRSWPAQQERMHRFLLEGDELGVRQLVERLHEGGVEMLTLCEELFTPALARVGRGWAEGRVSVAVEHRASAICERALARIAVHPRGRPRGVAVVCTPPGDEHALPAAMAALCLRADRWQVHHLGTQVPVPDLVALLASAKAELLVLSVCNPELDGGLDAAARAAADVGVTVLVGGPGRSLRELVELARAS